MLYMYIRRILLVLSNATSTAKATQSIQSLIQGNGFTPRKENSCKIEQDDLTHPYLLDVKKLMRFLYYI